jgi:hypothetical protein
MKQSQKHGGKPNAKTPPDTCSCRPRGAKEEGKAEEKDVLSSSKLLEFAANAIRKPSCNTLVDNIDAMRQHREAIV